ncbi:MAG: type I secretion system permease/ATPase [Alphaproteobacteria bacterium PA4]|nr:MAG: type I secretion system permease/ATPase [Alphaproteobacteria bacterium PA4]
MVALPVHARFSPEIPPKSPDAARLPPRAGDWLRAPLWANRALYGQVVLAAVLINLFGLATSFFSMAVYNKVVPAAALNSLLALVIGVLGVLAFDFMLRTLRGYFVDIAGQNVDRALGSAIFDRLLAMPLADRRGANGAFAGVLREFETLRDFFASATVAALVDVPFVLVFIAVIAWVAPSLALVPLLAIPIVIGSALLVQPLLARLAEASLGEGLNKQGIVVETIAGLETVKTSRAAPLLRRRWQAAVAHHAALALRQRLVAALPVNIALSAQALVYVAMLALGVSLVIEQRLTMGALVAATMLSGRCVAPLGQIATLLTRLTATQSAYRALDRLMAGAGDGPTPLRRAHLGGGITFRNVSFRYPGSARRTLDAVSFSIAPGERVAIIGRVGSGKSTITRLALGLYQPEDGAVLIDGSDIRQLHPDDIAANIGSVLQDIVLLSGSIRDNIALGDPAISDAEVLRASRLAGAHDFIGQLPDGYDRQLADRGEGLSGGQRQALAIARALAGTKPMLLMDEPTSAMDSQSEADLIDRLADDLDGRTLLLVTHRQSLLRLCTRIIMVDGGRIIADGPRDDVLRALLPA